MYVCALPLQFRMSCNFLKAPSVAFNVFAASEIFRRLADTTSVGLMCFDTA